MRLVFNDWIDPRRNRPADDSDYLRLALGDFHSGSTFEATLNLDPEQAEELRMAAREGFSPCFYAILAQPDQPHKKED